MTPRHTWIASPAELDAAVERWRSENEIAFDTEFVYERTYRPRPGLVQLAVGSEVALVDAVALADLGALGELLSAPRVLKVVHSGDADVALLERLAGVRTTPVFDTQIGAAFCGLGPALSYAALVEAVSGVTLAKAETRTDWTRRPLRPEQLRYATEDVAHLPAAATQLRARLRELCRLEWALEDSAAAVAVALEVPDAERSWRRVRGFGGLRGEARRVARELAAWREREAERLDLARPFLLRDETLLALAHRGELAPDDARRLPGFDARRHAPHVESWRLALAAARAAAALAPAAPEPRPPGRELVAARERLDERIAAAAAEIGRALELPAELLLSRRQRERLIAEWDGAAPLSGSLTGFRRDLLGEALDCLVPSDDDRALFVARD